MKRILLTLVLLCCMPASAQASEATDLAARESISPELAEHDLAAQQARPEVAEDVKAKLGSCYGGVWFNLKTGYWTVDVPPCTTKAAAAQALAGAKYQAVKSTWAELETRKQSLDSGLANYEQQAQVSTYIYPQTNSVRVLYSSSLPLAEREQIKAYVASNGDSSSATKASMLKTTEAAAECKLPDCTEGSDSHRGVVMGGSQENFGFSARCTHGFVIWHEGGWWILTAGHCDWYLATWTYPYNFYHPGWWQNVNDTTACHEWGGPFLKGETDAGLARLENCKVQQAVVKWPGTDPFFKPQEILTAAPKANTLSCIGGVQCSNARPLEQQGYVGEVVCKSGATNGSSCGKITGIDQTVTTAGVEGHPEVVSHLEKVQLEDATEGGDSGGPIWARAGDNEAVANGITVAAPESRAFTYEYATEVPWALNALGVGRY